MLVSIIIPCYNVEKYISACLDSVLNQQYTNIEIVAVDNNSMDATFSILKEYEAKFPQKIVVIQEKQKGAPAARNAGFYASKGDVISFLDGDDVITKDKFAKQVECLLHENAEVVISDRVIFDETLQHQIKALSFEQIKEKPLNTAITDIIITGNPIYKREVVAELGAYTLDLPNSQDWEFHLRMVLKRYKIAYCKGNFLICRAVPDSLSSNWHKVSFTVCKLLVLFRTQILAHGEKLEIATETKIFNYFYNSAIFAPTSIEKDKYLADMYLYLSTPTNYLRGWRKIIGKILGFKLYFSLMKSIKNMLS